MLVVWRFNLLIYSPAFLCLQKVSIAGEYWKLAKDEAGWLNKDQVIGDSLSYADDLELYMNILGRY